MLLVNKRDQADGAGRGVPGRGADARRRAGDRRQRSFGRVETQIAASALSLTPQLPARAGAGGLRRHRARARQFLSQIGASGDRVGASEGDAGEFEWRFLFVAGMWFQDLFNYDFRRTEMCIIPYGTQMGEISFCAYNTGVGFRQIVEKMKMTATVADWFKDARASPGLREEPEVSLPDTPLDVALRNYDGRRRLKLVS